MNNLYTPAPRQPRFACSQCVRRFFNRAGLKNHIHAKHLSVNHSGQPQSPPAHGPPSHQQSSDEEHPRHSPSVEIHDAESINLSSFAGTEQNFIQPPLFDEYDANHDHDFYNYHSENNIPDHDLRGSASRSSTPISVPSSQPHKRRAQAHQQKPADDKYLKKIYHPTLNGK